MISQYVKSIISIFILVTAASCTVRNNYEEVSKSEYFANNSRGCIYAVKSDSDATSISRYDIKQRKWTKIEGSDKCSEKPWDLSGSYVACLLMSDKNEQQHEIGIFNLPEFNLAKKIKYANPNFPPPSTPLNPPGLIKLSPDNGKIALLLFYNETPSQKYNGHCYVIPEMYKLYILSTKDGSVIFNTDGRYRGDTLEWDKNSKGVYLSSFSNQNIFYTTPETTLCTPYEQGISYDDKDVFLEDILYVDIETGNSKKIAEARSPKIFITNDAMYYSSWKKFYVWNLFKYDFINESSSLLGSLSSVRVKAVSPDGKWLIGSYTTDIPSETFSLLINTSKLRDRLVFDDSWIETAVWEK